MDVKLLRSKWGCDAVLTPSEKGGLFEILAGTKRVITGSQVLLFGVKLDPTIGIEESTALDVIGGNVARQSGEVGKFTVSGCAAQLTDNYQIVASVDSGGSLELTEVAPAQAAG